MANEPFAALARPDTGRRLLITFGILLVYRLGLQVPVPGISAEALGRLGGAKFELISLFALGVTPFLSAYFIFEFAKLIVPPLARWETADARNARRLGRYAYFLALVMAGMQARGVANGLAGISGILDGPGWETPIAITFVAGVALLGWLGDRISAQGLGNGFWLLVTTPVLMAVPAYAAQGLDAARQGVMTQGALVAIGLFLAVGTALVAAVETRRGNPEHRMTGADFVGVWPPLLATLIASFGIALSNEYAGGPFHIAAIVLLIGAFNGLQYLGAAPGSQRPYATVTLVQIAICVTGELLNQWPGMPVPINGAWLIVAVTAILSCLRPKDVPAPAASPAQAPAA